MEWLSEAGHSSDKDEPALRFESGWNQRDFCKIHLKAVDNGNMLPMFIAVSLASIRGSGQYGLWRSIPRGPMQRPLPYMRRFGQFSACFCFLHSAGV